MTMARFIAAVLCLLYASMIHHVYGQSGGSECTTPYALRLEQAESFTSEPFSAFSGRLEMCYCSGNMAGTPDDCMWSVVNSGSPTVPWSWKNVQVACRQLARDTGARFTGQGNPIILTSVPDEDISPNPTIPMLYTCDGTESHLVNCSSSTATNTIYNTFITCYTAAFSSHVKLTASTSNHEGVLEIYLNATGQWETICVDNFVGPQADVACRSMGYESGRAVYYDNFGFGGTELVSPPHIVSITCSGSERDIDSCLIHRSGGGGQICTQPNRLAGVDCTESPLPDGSIRLFNITGYHAFGRVEVLYGGRWGTVCNSMWDINAGQVACSQLREGSVARIPQSLDDFFPIVNSQRPIWETGYTCSGNETSLSLCNKTWPIGYAPFCVHMQDAGLHCEIPPYDGLSPGAIAGIVIGTLLFIILIPICIFAIVCLSCIFCDCDPDSCDDCCHSISTCCRRIRRRSRRRGSFRVSHHVTRETSEDRYDDTAIRVEDEVKEMTEEEVLALETKGRGFIDEAPPTYKESSDLDPVQPPPEYEDTN